MYSEEFYETKKESKKEMIIIAIAYFIAMFVVPHILYIQNFIIIDVRNTGWSISGNAVLPFIIMSVSEFLVGLIVTLLIKKPYIYYIINLCSFIIKFIIYVFNNLIIWIRFISRFVLPLALADTNFYLYRLIASFVAFDGVFFIPTILCFAAFFGIQTGLLIKNKKREKDIEGRLNASKNR